METIQGIVVRSQSGFYNIDTDQGPYVARMRGKHKKGRKKGDLIAVGDIVQISLHKDGTAMIEEIEERKCKLSRLAPTARGTYEQIIIANPDQAVLTFACAEPAPKMRMLDRFLIIAEEQEIPILIVANKTDLTGMSKAKKLFNHYRSLGYDLIYTSVNKKRGIRTLHQKLKGKVSVFAGPSGVGKSSLLNAIQPNLGLQVNEVSKSNRKGKHTTVVRAMFPLKDGGYVADTPGLKALALWDIEPEELDAYFREISPLVPHCRFSSCTHIQEPDCAVLKAVESGDIHPERYESYVRLRYGDQD